MHPKDRSGGQVRTPSRSLVVPLRLADDQRETLRETCLSALHGILDDLTKPHLLADPAGTAREGEVFRRLLEALDTEEIRVPDEELRERVVSLSERYAATEDVEEIRANLGAHRAVLEVLDAAPEEEDETLRRPGPGRLPGDDESCRREILDLLLAEAPNRLLIQAGLSRRQGGVPAPKRPVRLMVGLGFRIG